MNNLNQPEKDPSEFASFYGQELRRKSEEKDRVFPSFLVLLFVVVGFGAIIWLSYPDSSADINRDNLPIIRADSGNYKEKPKDQGGIDVLHRDSTVFAPLEIVDKSTPENILPDTEEPVERAQMTSKAMGLKSLENKEPEVLIGNKSITEEIKRVEDVKKDIEFASNLIPKETPNSVKAEIVKNISPIAESLIEPEAIEVTEKKEVKPVIEEIELIKKTIEPVKVVEVQKAIKAEDIKISQNGKSIIQLGSFKEERLALNAWNIIKGSNSSLLKNIKPFIQRADLGDKGIYYRVKITKLNRSSAKRICSKLNSRQKNSCLVTRL